MANPHVVVVGGGFAGLRAVQTLKRIPVDVTLIDCRNFHLFQPLLYQVATGGLSPANIATPLRYILKRQRNVRVLLGTVTDFDVDSHVVIAGTRQISYDFLILAAGARSSYFGNPRWSKTAQCLKTIEDATEIRAQILAAFETAEKTAHPTEQRLELTFVIIGGGPTGVELAGAVAELAKDTLRREFRGVRPEGTRILLIEAADRILPTYPQKASQIVAKQLASLGVTVRSGCKVHDIRPNRVILERNGSSETIESHTTLWAAGIRASSLGRLLADRMGAILDESGRVKVQMDLSLPGHPNVFVLGDLACCPGKDDSPLPALAPVALQQGRYVGRLIAARLRGEDRPPFQYKDRGNLATVGRSAAVGVFGRVVIGGFVAWLIWLFVHLMLLVRHENRVLVFVQWAFNYITRNRGARLITASSRALEDETPDANTPRATD